jgi:Transcription termination factor nusG
MQSNMRQAYLDVPSRLEASGTRRLAPPEMRAEIAGERALWHVVRTEPGQASSAAKYLSRCGFGVYVPQFFKRLPASSRRPARVESRLVFPSHVFIWVWDVMRHLRRIRSCPGVLDLLWQRAEMPSGALLLHPAVMPDAIIRHLQAVEFGMMRFRRPRKGWRGKAMDYELPRNDNVVLVRCYSALRDVTVLDEAGREAALLRALGLQK